MVVDAKCDNIQVEYQRDCALRCYLLFLVGTSMCVAKSVTSVDVFHLKYFIDLTSIHDYNRGATYLVYLYLKLSETSLWKTKQFTGSCVFLMVIYY